MMVYRGGNHWTDALESLSECRDLFDTLVISFDGPTRFELANLLYETYWDSLQPEVLVTPKVLSSVEHACWIAQQSLVRQWSETDFVVLLSEDDRLRPESFRGAVAKATKTQGCALFGSWTVECGELPDTSSSPGINSVEATRLGQWLNRVAESGHPTSITATLTPVAAHRNYISVLQGQFPDRPLFSGVRAEYLLVTQAPIKRILWSGQPIAVIQQHEQQESKSLPRHLWTHDEALFQLWLAMTPLQLGAAARAFAVMRSLKWLSLNPSTILDLRNAIKTFRLARKKDTH